MRRIRHAGIEEEPSSPGITFRLSTNPAAGPRGAPNGWSTSFSASLKTNRSRRGQHKHDSARRSRPSPAESKGNRNRDCRAPHDPAAHRSRDREQLQQRPHCVARSFTGSGEESAGRAHGQRGRVRFLWADQSADRCRAPAVHGQRGRVAPAVSTGSGEERRHGAARAVGKRDADSGEESHGHEGRVGSPVSRAPGKSDAGAGGETGVIPCRFQARIGLSGQLGNYIRTGSSQ
jgi:hypothetical protein